MSESITVAQDATTGASFPFLTKPSSSEHSEGGAGSPPLGQHCHRDASRPHVPPLPNLHPFFQWPESQEAPRLPLSIPRPTENQCYFPLAPWSALLLSLILDSLAPTLCPWILLRTLNPQLQESLKSSGMPQKFQSLHLFLTSTLIS